MHVLRFIAFLVVYVASLSLISVATNKVALATLKNKTFWSTECYGLLNIAMIFGFTFTLTGYFNWTMVLVFFFATQIGVVMMAILRGFFSSPTSSWGPCGVWAGAEFGIRHKLLMLGNLLISLLVVLAYPVMVGISYFSLSDPALTTRIFQYTLGMFSIAGYLYLTPILIGVLVSENIDEDTRTHYFLSQLSSVTTNALMLALLFWSFGLAAGGNNVSIGSISLTLSPLLLGLLIGQFILTVLIPFFIGPQRAKQWRTTLLNEENDWIENTKNILEVPIASTYLPKLAELQGTLETRIGEFIAGDEIIDNGVKVDLGSDDSLLRQEPVLSAYKLARNFDPRFKHLDWLHEWKQQLATIHDELAKFTHESELEAMAKKWVTYLNSSQKKIDAQIGQIDKSPRLIVIITSVLAPIFSVILSELGHWLWNHYTKSQSPPQ